MERMSATGIEVSDLTSQLAVKQKELLDAQKKREEELKEIVKKADKLEEHRVATYKEVWGLLVLFI